jgi:signal transduction histidine kinase
MKTQCVMCGSETSTGILCERCDRPKRSSTSKGAAAPAPVLEEAADAELFPKAPIVPFPMESTSLALTSMYEVLALSETPAVLIGADRKVRFFSQSARQLLGWQGEETPPARALEMHLGTALTPNPQSQSTPLQVGEASVTMSVVPLSGGANGAVLLFKQNGGSPAAPAAASSSAAASPDGLQFVRETVLAPLSTILASLDAALSKGRKDPVLRETVLTIEQVLSSLQLSPLFTAARTRRTGAPRPIAKLLRQVADRFEQPAAAKNVRLQIDSPETSETFGRAEELTEVLGQLVENALHYVPSGGQVVLGLRFLEHKGQPLLLFFVMDNGPLVPEEMRKSIFDPAAEWTPSDSRRSGKGLARVQDFATSCGGMAWVESKTGKACTFFLRVMPDAEE